MADQEDKHAGEIPEKQSKKDTGQESEDKRQDPRAEDPVSTSLEKKAIKDQRNAFYLVLLAFRAESLTMGNKRDHLLVSLKKELNISKKASSFLDNKVQEDLNDLQKSDDAKLTEELKTIQLEGFKREAFYYVLLAFRAETLTTANTQIIEELMNEWDITHETRISVEDHIHQRLIARQQRYSEKAKEVEAKLPNISQEHDDDNTRDDEPDKLTQVTKTEALGFLLNAYKDVTSTMEKARVIQELSVHWKETKPIVPPPHVVINPNPVRMRKGVEKFSEIDHRRFHCTCGQRFYQQSNLTTHRKRCREAEMQRIFDLVPKKLRSVFHIFCAAPSDGIQRNKRQSKLRSAFKITQKPLPSRAASQRRALHSVIAAFKGESSTEEDRALFIANLREAWGMPTQGLMRMKTGGEDARAPIDLSEVDKEEIMLMIGAATALLKLKQSSVPPLVVDDEEEEEEA